MNLHPETAVALLNRAAGETMSVDEARAKLDQESPAYDPALHGRLLAYAEKERRAIAFKDGADDAGLAFR